MNKLALFCHSLVSRNLGNPIRMNVSIEIKDGAFELFWRKCSKAREVSSRKHLSFRFAGSPKFRSVPSESGFGVLLVVVFLALLSCALFVFLDIKEISLPESSPAEQLEGRQSIISFRRGQAAIKVAHSPSLDPSGAEDRVWALLVSTRFKKLPPVDARNVVAVKYDKLRKPYLGWALALANHGGVCCFPEVYWSSGQGGGEWHRFPRIDVQLDQWWLLGFSFEKGRYLVGWAQQIQHGKGASALAGPGASMLGAYDLGLGSIAASNGDFYLGAPSDNSFRGSIDFAGIFEGPIGLEEVWFEATANALFGEGIFDLHPDKTYTSLYKVLVLPDGSQQRNHKRERGSKRELRNHK